MSLETLNKLIHQYKEFNTQESPAQEIAAAREFLKGYHNHLSHITVYDLERKLSGFTLNLLKSVVPSNYMGHYIADCLRDCHNQNLSKEEINDYFKLRCCPKV
jgi:hypothetical protein